MKRVELFASWLMAGLLLLVGCGEKEGYNITPIAFNKVSVNDAFWLNRIQTNREVTIPIAFGHCEKTGRINNFKIAGGLMEGKFQSDAPFDDSDVSKIIEGAAYSLTTFPDAKLEAYVDTLISYYAAAQEDDGYLYTWRTIMGDNSHDWIGSKRWEFTHVLSHELYNLGHMFEAGVAYYQATGKRNLLDVCIKAADLLCKDFGPDGIHTWPGHQEVEIGLVKLYGVTGEKKYLDLAKFFLDVRGNCTDKTGSTYDQSHKPVVEQEEAVGHSVRALYMFTGMADVAAITGDDSYNEASHRLWKDIVETKLYITGGVGAAGGHEGFGAKYELPNLSAYCETCAAIANVFWNYRMFLNEGDGKYIDVLERALYNNVLSGVAMTGDRFFYPNPLESLNGGRRSEWFGCACCPSNIARFIPAVPGYQYAVKDNEVYVNLYMASKANFNVDGTEVEFVQTGDMPWSGDIKIVVNPAVADKFAVKVRIPGWANNEPVPGNILYHYAEVDTEKPVVTLNGEVVNTPIESGYVTIDKKWNKGDVIGINLPMSVHKVVASDSVVTNIGKIALQRGPIVYCAEGIDFEDRKINDLIVDINGEFTPELVTNQMGRMVELNGKAKHTKRTIEGKVVTGEECNFKAIPYYAWAHRETSPMVIWFPTTIESAKPKPAPTIANTSKIDGSLVNRDIEGIRDQIMPAGSNDRNCQFFHWWPNANQTEWISYTFDKPRTISKSLIFWFSDGGGCKAPKAWRLYYQAKKGGEWIPVKTDDPFGTELNYINIVDFEPVKAVAAKIEIDLPIDCSSGIHEWIIE